MDFEKFTDRARGFVQSAQSLALREGHQQFDPEHLLKVLLDDPEGLAAGLIDRSGGNSRQALRDVEAALAKRPKVSGAGRGRSIRIRRWLAHSTRPRKPERGRRQLLNAPVQRLLLALALEKDSDAGKNSRKSRRDCAEFQCGHQSLRRVALLICASAENAYDALKKYARDLTQVARDGKLDPVIGRDEEIRRTIQVLSRRTKNNPYLSVSRVSARRQLLKDLRCELSMATCRKQKPSGQTAARARSWRDDCRSQISR